MEINRLGPVLQKTLDLGKVDLWFREIARIAPQSTQTTKAASRKEEPEVDGMSVEYLDINLHKLSYGSSGTITQTDIEKTAGLQQILQVCSQRNVCVEILKLGADSLEVSFEPDKSFAQSKIFGKNYTNVLPVIFTAKSRTPL